MANVKSKPNYPMPKGHRGELREILKAPTYKNPPPMPSVKPAKQVKPENK